MPPKKKKTTRRKPARKASSLKKKRAPAGKILKKKAPQPRKAKQAKAKAGQIKAAVIGKVTHYFPHVNAAVLKLKLPLKAGDTIHIKGHSSDFTQSVDSIQIEHANASEAKFWNSSTYRRKSRRFSSGKSTRLIAAK